MKLMASGVIISAAIARSPSFSAIFVVNHHHHPPGFKFFDRSLNRGEKRSAFVRRVSMSNELNGLKYSDQFGKHSTSLVHTSVSV